MATDNYNAHDWKVGDIIDGTFRYSAAIPHFYIVSRKSEKCVWLISLGKVSYASDQYGQEGQCMPNLAERGTKDKMHRITKGGYVRIDSYTAGKVLTGAVWKDCKRCMEEWEEIKNNNKINWI